MNDVPNINDLSAEKTQVGVQLGSACCPQASRQVGR